MKEVDRLMIEEYGIELIQMMENAGSCLARLARNTFLKGKARGKNVTILAGTGGNGGGALACARRLRIAGAKVHIVLAAEADDYSPTAARQLATLARMGVLFHKAIPKEQDLIVDGLIGYNLDGAPRGFTATLIVETNKRLSPVLSVDLPSGLQPDTGAPMDPCIRASATLTLALPKAGLAEPQARPYVGELFLADISVPQSLYASPGLGFDLAPIFSESDILHVMI